MASIYDLKIAPLVAEGKEPGEIARTLGMRESDVKRLVARTRGHQFSRSFATKSNQRRTEADDLYFPLWVKDFTDEEIAEKTGKSVNTVRGWRNSRNLKPSTRQVKKNAEERAAREAQQRAESDAKFLPLYEKGLPDTEIAKILGCKPETVGNWRGRRGLVSNRPPTKAKKKVQA